MAVKKFVSRDATNGNVVPPEGYDFWRDVTSGVWEVRWETGYDFWREYILR